jgi:hypothetical protein
VERPARSGHHGRAGLARVSGFFPEQDDVAARNHAGRSRPGLTPWCLCVLSRWLGAKSPLTAAKGDQGSKQDRCTPRGDLLAGRGAVHTESRAGTSPGTSHFEESHEPGTQSASPQRERIFERKRRGAAGTLTPPQHDRRARDERGASAGGQHARRQPGLPAPSQPGRGQQRDQQAERAAARGT